MTDTAAAPLPPSIWGTVRLALELQLRDLFRDGQDERLRASTLPTDLVDAVKQLHAVDPHGAVILARGALANIARDHWHPVPADSAGQCLSRSLTLPTTQGEWSQGEADRFTAAALATD